jgi:16S rRNA (guanine527-N7)-methyltransferase
MSSDLDNFAAALRRHEAYFGLSLKENAFVSLMNFYDFFQTWNKRLHLVAPCSATEFAIRHVLESLCLLEFLPSKTSLADIGAGGGFPSLPCLIVREDLRGNLIESNAKKVVYLREAAAHLQIGARTTALNVRFEFLPPPEYGVVACRALDKFVEKLPEIVAWARHAERLVLFGGINLKQELEKINLTFAERLIPFSEQRFLFIVKNQ